jgi:hypothetical protein
MALAAAGNPNCVLVMLVFQVVKVTWLRKFVESIRKSRLKRPCKRKVLPIEASSVNSDGPMMESLPAFPHWPLAGGVYAAGFRNKPCGAA